MILTHETKCTFIQFTLLPTEKTTEEVRHILGLHRVSECSIVHKEDNDWDDYVSYCDAGKLMYNVPFELADAFSYFVKNLNVCYVF